MRGSGNIFVTCPDRNRVADKYRISYGIIFVFRVSYIYRDKAGVADMYSCVPDNRDFIDKSFSAESYFFIHSKFAIRVFCNKVGAYIFGVSDIRGVTYKLLLFCFAYKIFPDKTVTYGINIPYGEVLFSTHYRGSTHEFIPQGLSYIRRKFIFCKTGFELFEYRDFFFDYFRGYFCFEPFVNNIFRVCYEI